MSLRRWIESRRWWHRMGCTVTVLVAPAAVITGLLWPRVEVVVIAAFAVLILPALWWMVVVPWLNACDHRYARESTPSRRAGRIWLAAYWPFCAIWFLIATALSVALGTRLFTGRWPQDHWFNSWWAGALAIALYFGWLFNRVLQQRLRVAAAQANVCYRCGAALGDGATGGMCPACGESE